MAVRVAEPNRLRIAGLVVTALGVAWIVLASTRGALVLVGLPLLALGVAAWDLAYEGRASYRQLGPIVAIVGSGIALWSFFVITFHSVLDNGGPSWTWFALLVIGITLTLVGVVTRVRPQLFSGVASAVAGLSRSAARRGRGRRHAAPPTRLALSRRGEVRRGA